MRRQFFAFDLAGNRALSLLIFFGTTLFVCDAAQAQLGLVGSVLFPAGITEAGNRHYSALGVVDLNGDGDYEVVAGGADYDGPGGLTNRGRFEINGLFGTGHSSSTFIYSCSGSDDFGSGYRLGATIATGDFDNDGFGDVAIGMPGAAAGSSQSGGAVCVVYGGQTDSANELLRQRLDQTDTPGVAENGDQFGAALAVGDLNGDGYDDLAIGVPGEDVVEDGETVVDAGAVNVIFGSEGGLLRSSSVILHHGNNDSFTAETSERFGSSLAIGGFFVSTGQQQDDLLVGTPNDRLGAGGGSVYGYAGLPSTTLGVISPYYPGSPTWNLLGTAVIGDQFGFSMATGDFDGNGWDDVAIGIPGDNDLGLAAQSGAVMVLYGNGNLMDTNEQVFYESIIDGHPNGVSPSDRFGEVLTVGDFNGDGRDELVIGAPLDDSLGVVGAGEVTVLYGTEAGLSVAGSQVFDMIFFGPLVPGDEFGAALATGKLFDQHGGDDLLVGVPGFTPANGVFPDSGAMVVIQSLLFFQDGFETGDISAWSGQ